MGSAAAANATAADGEKKDARSARAMVGSAVCLTSSAFTVAPIHEAAASARTNGSDGAEDTKRDKGRFARHGALSPIRE